MAQNSRGPNVDGAGKPPQAQGPFPSARFLWTGQPRVRGGGAHSFLEVVSARRSRDSLHMSFESIFFLITRFR